MVKEQRKVVIGANEMHYFKLVKKRNEKSYQVQAFCEERGLTPVLGVIW